jgi:hypothetical protein
LVKVKQPTVWVPKIEEWTAPSDAEITRRRSFSVVVYAPKYDEQLRVEAEVTVNSEGEFEVHVDKVGRNKRIGGNIGTFENYEEAKAELYEKFFEYFNRPSEMAIKSGKRRPTERVWDFTRKGRETKRSVSLIEGDDAKQVLGTRVTEKELTRRRRDLKTYKVDVPELKGPTVISVRRLYPDYFKHVSQTHVKRMTRLKKFRKKRK